MYLRCIIDEHKQDHKAQHLSPAYPQSAVAGEVVLSLRLRITLDFKYGFKKETHLVVYKTNNIVEITIRRRLLNQRKVIVLF